MQTAAEQLLIFARYPELGRVKTRLAAAIGDEAALAVYQELLEHTRQAIGPLSCAATLWLDEAAPAPLWPGYPQRAQAAGADLGQRMHQAFVHAFAAGASRAVVIGTDCPGLSTELLRAAFVALHTHEVVLGPAHDGGYYLLGLRGPQPDLFAGIAWSTDTVLADTLRIAAEHTLSVAMLPTLRDVDTLADLAAWRAEE